jgi:hypothetical protein
MGRLAGWRWRDKLKDFMDVPADNRAQPLDDGSQRKVCGECKLM